MFFEEQLLMDKSRLFRSRNYYSLRNLASTRHEILTCFQNYAAQHLLLNHDQFVHLDYLSQNISSLNEFICLQLDLKKIQPAQLSPRSQRFFLWIGWLSAKQNLITHLNSLSKILSIIENTTWAKMRKPPNYQLIIDNSPYLYRSEIHNNRGKFQINEAFVTSTHKIFQSLVRLVFDQPEPSDRSLIKKYIKTPEFQLTYRRLSIITKKYKSSTVGDFYNLEVVFNRVNNTLFNGELEKPGLNWTRKNNFRRFGYYSQDHNLVFISKILDNSTIPDYVIDFVMYHELLHVKIGIDLANGRRRAHTPAFKQLEKKFPFYEKAKYYLRELSSKSQN